MMISIKVNLNCMPYLANVAANFAIKAHERSGMGTWSLFLGSLFETVNLTCFEKTGLNSGVT